MNWQIVVKPTSYNLTSYGWTAQRSDNEAFLMQSMPLPTKEQALAEAQAEITEYEERRTLIEANTLVEDFDPLAVVEE